LLIIEHDTWVFCFLVDLAVNNAVIDMSYVEGETKAGRRKIGLTGVVLEALKEHRERQ
jgi:hypothetical protein